MKNNIYIKSIEHEICSLKHEVQVYEKDVKELTEAIAISDLQIQSAIFAKDNYTSALNEYKEKLKISKEKLDILEKIKYRAEN